MRPWRRWWRRGLKGNARQQKILRLVDMPALVELERRVGVDLGVRLGSDGQAAVRNVQRLDRGAADLFARIPSRICNFNCEVIPPKCGSLTYMCVRCVYLPAGTTIFGGNVFVSVARKAMHAKFTYR